MLKQRVITAAVLLLIIAAALMSPSGWPFLLLAWVMVCAGAWEWARLNGLADGSALAFAGLIGLAVAAGWFAGLAEQRTPGLWLVAGACWVLVIFFMLRGGVAMWQKVPRFVRLVGGALALWLTWLAIAQARVLGIEMLLSVFALVWVADISAYFAGRALGQKFFTRKLAPAISPGKSWEGALGGMLGVMLLGGIWASLGNGVNLYGILSIRGWIVFVLGLVFLTLVSVAGDLIESLVKRSAGVKDSSQLLPGHGGVLDRIDALLPTFPMAMMLVAVLS